MKPHDAGEDGPRELVPVPDNCRSCKAVIRWAYTEKNGKRVPIDAEKKPRGNLELVFTGGRHVVRYVKPDETPRYWSHFATCTKAQSWRGAQR